MGKSEILTRKPSRFGILQIVSYYFDQVVGTQIIIRYIYCNNIYQVWLETRILFNIYASRFRRTNLISIRTTNQNYFNLWLPKGKHSTECVPCRTITSTRQYHQLCITRCLFVNRLCGFQFCFVYLKNNLTMNNIRIQLVG